MAHPKRHTTIARWLLTVALIATSTVLTTTPAAAVVGGAELTPGELDAIAFTGDCTGTLIAPTWVLSAGHCVRGGSPIRIGSVHNNAGGEVREPKRYVRHPGFPDPKPVADFLANDLMLIELTEPSTIAPLPMATPDQAAAWAGGATVTVSGFGIACGFFAWGDPPCAGVDVDAAHTADLPVLDGAGCMAMTGYASLDPTTMICGLMPGGGVSACAGDSGGPLTAIVDGAPVLIGVVSGGLDPCGRPDGPNVFTKVAAFREWIQQTTQPVVPTSTTTTTTTTSTTPASQATVASAVVAAPAYAG